MKKLLFACLLLLPILGKAQKIKSATKRAPNAKPNTVMSRTDSTDRLIDRAIKAALDSLNAREYIKDK
jgi:hypothetical protein